MSRVNKVVAKPCCKVCKDAGKSFEEYSSHWPKDDSGRVICITLLNQTCRYCSGVGHTVKYCSVLAKDKSDKAKVEAFCARQKRIKAYEETKSAKKTSAVAPAVSRFALLMDDTESDDSPRSPKRTQKKAPAIVEDDEFPTLSGKSERKATNWPERGVQMAWSDVINATSGSVTGHVQIEMSGLCEYSHKTKELSAREKAAAIHRQECFKGLNGKGWADFDESDDENW